MLHTLIMNTTLKQLEMRQVMSTKSSYDFNQSKNEMTLTFYRPWKSGLPSVTQIQVYTRQQLEDDYEIDQTYKFYSLDDIKEVYRYDEKLDFPHQTSLSDIVDNTYYQFKVSLKIKDDSEY